jgi:predicted RNA binding protein YcfA (HicA-like mRNA interferase family)
MTRLPGVRAIEAMRALERAGLIVVRIKGSHHIMEHPDDPSRRTVVPLHKGKDLPRGLLRKIITDAGLTVEEFADLL